MEARPPERPDLYVLARFLDVLRDAPDGYPRTRLQGAVRLNYDLYRRYLALLVDRKLAEIVGPPEGERVRLTEAGEAAHARLVGWIRDAFGDIRL